MTDWHKVLSNLNTKLSYTEGRSIAIRHGLDLEYSTGEGLARVNPDVKMSSWIRMDVLSMSKTITAAGIVRQLLANGLTPQEKIGPHLPSYWSVHPQVANLTFAHILTHSGGLVGDQSDFDQLQTLCASKPAGIIGKVSYQNANYSLLRVLLAYLASAATLHILEVPFARQFLSSNTAVIYVENIKTNILKPSGVIHASIGSENPASGQAEWFKDAAGNLGDQHHPANALLVCGADHWNMNVRDYSRFIAHLVNGNLSPNPWPTMRDTRAPGAAGAPPIYPNGDARLGVWRFQAPDGTGNFYGHNGGWSDAFTGWMAFEDGSNVTFFGNSTKGPAEQERMILDSWLNA
jgi:CubicO group peptidase (beta-lactamase class C family)